MRTYTLWITALCCATVPVDAPDPGALADAVAADFFDYAALTGSTFDPATVEATRSAIADALWSGERTVCAPPAVRHARIGADLFVGARYYG